MCGLYKSLLANVDRTWARKQRDRALSQLLSTEPLSVRYCRDRWICPRAAMVDCFLCCGEDAEDAASGATSIACVAFAPDGGGRKEGRL